MAAVDEQTQTLIAAIEHAPDDDAALLPTYAPLGIRAGPLVDAAVPPSAAHKKALVGTLRAYGASIKLDHTLRPDDHDRAHRSRVHQTTQDAPCGRSIRARTRHVGAL